MLEYILDIYQGLKDFFYRCLLSVFDFLKDFLWWVLDMLFGAVISILNGLGFDLGDLNPAMYISAIPPEVKWVMTQCGFNECMAILVTAFGIRLTLQIIPFVRLGS